MLLSPIQDKSMGQPKAVPTHPSPCPPEVTELGGQRGQWVLGRTSVRWW